MKFQLVAVNKENKKVQIINESDDQEFLDKISENAGIVWISNEPCDLHVVRA